MIPRPALYLGLAGVLPFAASALAPLVIKGTDGLALASASLSIYGVTILAFMSGCIWAFAARADDWPGYALSTLPALFGFLVPTFAVFFDFASPKEVPALLAVGFLLLLLLDWRASRRGQTPVWWMRLRLLLTTLVIIFLVLGTLL